MGGWGGLGVIIKSNLNRVKLLLDWVGVGLGCDNLKSFVNFSSKIDQFAGLHKVILKLERARNADTQ